MKNCRIVIFVTKCTEKVVKSLYFHGKIAVFQNPLVRARGNLSLGPCFSGCPEPNGPQKIYEILAGRIEASKVICPAVGPCTNDVSVNFGIFDPPLPLSEFLV